ncbi:low molecular weight phosphatase family protein [Candidatus Woesearchaeota archaeon]|nr:MAG: low molecular weight phosphatase family protein [Candidatus Woesearchaeota archaeon]
MNILFICSGNVGRSQMAAALFTQYAGIKAFSAGIKVFENENQKLKDHPLAKPVITLMKKEGLDVSQNKRTQVTQKMLSHFDKIIVMSEPEIIPEYLSKNKNTEFWNIQDPQGMDDKGYEKVAAQIKANVKAFIALNKLCK